MESGLSMIDDSNISFVGSKGLGPYPTCSMRTGFWGRALQRKDQPPSKGVYAF